MKKQLLSMLFLTFSMVCAEIAHAETVYYVQSTYAKIYAEPSLKSASVASVEMGQMLTSTGKQGIWVQVTQGGKNGYIPSLLLATQPPINKLQIVKADAPEIDQGVRRRTSSYSSAAAARGLTKEDRTRADVEEGVNFKALFEMEALTISGSELKKFAEAGRL